MGINDMLRLGALKERLDRTTDEKKREKLFDEFAECFVDSVLTPNKDTNKDKKDKKD